MPGIYRVEISAKNRAGCRNKECKDAGIKIFKGQIRLGTWVAFGEFQNWHWKHWGCVTPKQIVNIKNVLDNDATQLDGYEDLPEDCQAKISKALKEGHVADEDWMGDIEMNRGGKNGYRTPESKKAKKQEIQESMEDGSASPSKAPSKKRGHVKADPDGEGATENEPAPKKRKATVKKEKKVKEEGDADKSADETKPMPKKKKTTVKKEKIKDEDAEEDVDYIKPTPRKRKAAVKNEKDIKEEAAANNSEEEDLVAGKKNATVKKEKIIKSEDAGSIGNEELPTQRGRKNRKRNTKVKDEDGDQSMNAIKSEGSDEDATTKPSTKGPRVLGNTKSSNKIKDEDSKSGDPGNKSNLTDVTDVNTTNNPRGAALTTRIKEEGYESSDLSDLPESRKATIAKKIKAEDFDIGSPRDTSAEQDSEPEVESDFDDRASVAKSKTSKGGRKATKSVPKGGRALNSRQPKKTSEDKLGASINAEKPKRANGRVTRSQPG